MVSRPMHSPTHAQPPALRRLIRAVALRVTMLAFCTLAATTADAGIASTSGAISVIAHPTGTLASNNLESDTTIYAWFEQTIVNPGTQSFDHRGAGTVNSNGSANAGSATPGLAESYIVHFDHAGGGSASISGASITFDEAIIGVWQTTGGLSGSDAQWTPAGLTYGALFARRYELGTGGNSDRYSISADLRTITILNTFTVGNGVDQLRILVNPEPSTIALMGLGVLGLASIVRRRRRKQTAT